MRLLIIEDEPLLSAELRNYFKVQGAECEVAGSFLEAEQKILDAVYDMVLLDITLPGGTGLQLIEVLKKIAPQTGILIISAKDSLDDKIKGLELGADDYITKPFYLDEINARLNALWRRRNMDGAMAINLGAFHIDPFAKTVMYEAKELILTKKEFELFLYLVVNKNRVINKQAIADHLWGDHYEWDDNYDTVYTHTMNLRKKIKKISGQDYIKTVYGMGYKFIFP